jgi:hypothetical protein
MHTARHLHCTTCCSFCCVASAIQTLLVEETRQRTPSLLRAVSVLRSIMSCGKWLLLNMPVAGKWFLLHMPVAGKWLVLSMPVGGIRLLLNMPVEVLQSEYCITHPAFFPDAFKRWAVSLHGCTKAFFLDICKCWTVSLHGCTRDVFLDICKCLAVPSHGCTDDLFLRNMRVLGCFIARLHKSFFPSHMRMCGMFHRTAAQKLFSQPHANVWDISPHSCTEAFCPATCECLGCFTAQLHRSFFPHVCECPG